MKLENFLYLVQLEEYETYRIKNWLKNNPEHEVVPVKKQLVWTPKVKLLFYFAKILFFVPEDKSILLGIYFLKPLDFVIKNIIVLLAFIKLRTINRHVKVIAITGSWGKTTTKDTLIDLISSKFNSSATIGNHNTLLGVAIDILQLPSKTQYFIAEIGAYYPGDIRQVSKLLSPKFGIVTAIGPMHLERFGTVEKILNTKMELAEIIPHNGWLFLPDDVKQRIFHINLKSKNILFFKKIDDIYQQICQLLDIDSPTYKKILAAHSASDHRLQVTVNNGITIIDDTYNSNPAGFTLALQKLKEIKSDNKILITPGMIELGHLQESENSRLIKLASNLCQHIVVVGHTNRQALLAGLKNTKAKIHIVDQVSETLTLLPTITSPGAVVLFENDLPDNYL